MRTGNEKFFSRKAYTLIEILVGLTILSLIFTIGYGTYREFTRRQSVEATFRGVATTISLAKQRTLSGEKVPCSGTFVGYKTTIDQDSADIILVCTDGEFPVGPNFEFQESVSKDPPAAESITFKALGQGTDLPSDITITLVHSGSSFSKIFVITREGRVEVQ